jgi:Pentapeptide repeats (8 copies)
VRATVNLVADCSRCVGLCCVAPAFVASAEFAFSKPAGVACRHLAADSRCTIHDRLRPSGFAGCVAYDCFGAGQRTVSLFAGAGRSPAMLRAYEVVRQLHELLWYLSDALSRPAAAPVQADLAAAQAEIDAATAAGPDSIAATDPAAYRAAVAPLLRRASTLVRTSATPARPAAEPAARGGADLAGRDLGGADLVGRALVGADLRRADLSTAYLLGADLRGADLRYADLLGTDLRGAELAGADLTGALYLTRTQVGGARGSAATRLSDRLPHPEHWLTAGPPPG